jgi:integrase
MQALHDQIARSRGYRTAQLANTHMKLVFNWGNKFGWLNGRANPCNSIDLAKSLKSNHNRRWTQEELDNSLLNLPKHLATAVALAAYTGLRKSDVIKWEWHQYDENTGRIAGLTQKTSTTIDLPVHAKLKVILANADRFKGCTRIVASKRSPKGFTAMGFQASWQKAKAKLIEDGHCKEGITFHGLRHTIANALAEAGCAPLEIMAITGHTDAASVEAYIKEASKKRMADSGFQKLKAWEALYLNAPRISTDNESEISEAA